MPSLPPSFLGLSAAMEARGGSSIGDGGSSTGERGRGGLSASLVAAGSLSIVASAGIAMYRYRELRGRAVDGASGQASSARGRAAKKKRPKGARFRKLRTSDGPRASRVAGGDEYGGDDVQCKV